MDPTGVGTHPKAGADPTATTNRIVVQGIALNAAQDMLSSSTQWQVYVQGEGPDQGGIAAWAGIFYNPSWPRYPYTINAGDRIQIDGFIANNNGKTNINERHSALPAMQFNVTVLQAGVGLPAPTVIPSVAACNFFDQTRATGGERYQSTWCQLQGIEVVSGTWSKGQSLVVKDDTNATVTLLLSSEGDFTTATAPVGKFNATGIFDQEDNTSPYTEAYRLWVMKSANIQPAPAEVDRWRDY